MSGEHLAGLSGITGQCAVQQDPVLLGRDLAPEHDRHHLVAQVLVEHAAIKIEQGLRAAGLDQDMVKFTVVAFPEIRLLLIASDHPPLHEGQLVMGGDNPALLFQVAGGKGQGQRVGFQEQPHGRHVLEPGRRNRRDPEAALPLRNHQPFR